MSAGNKEVLSEEAASTRRLIGTLMEMDVPLELWSGIIEGAREECLLGSNTITDCIEKARAEQDES